MRVTLLLAALNYRELPAPIWRGLSGQCGGHRERRVNKLTNGPSLVGEPQRFRWCHAKDFMDTAQIVVRDLKRDGRNMVV